MPAPRRLIALLLAWLAVAALGPAQAGAQPARLLLATSPVGGGSFAIARGMCTLWSMELAGKGFQVQALVSDGSAENISRLKLGRAQLATVQAIFARMAWEGLALYQGAPVSDLRSVTCLWPAVAQFAAAPGIVKTGDISDLRGQTINVGPAGSGTAHTTMAILEALGIGRGDVLLKHDDYFEGGRALQAGLIQAACASGLPPTAAMWTSFAEAESRPVLLEVTPAQLERINAATLFTGRPWVIEAGLYPNQTKPCRTICQDQVLVCRADVSAERVYQMLKVYYAGMPDWGRPSRKMAGKGSGWINIERALDSLSAPLHPGALRYYREKGIAVPASLMPPGGAS